MVFGRFSAYWYRSYISKDDKTGGYVLMSGGRVASERSVSSLAISDNEAGI